MLTTLPKRIAMIVIGVVLLAGGAMSVVATPNSWNWKDQSGLLPYRDGRDLTLSSEASGRWLLSDGHNLYLYDGSNLTDLTKELRNRGMLGVSNLASDGRGWLVSYLPLDSSSPKLWLTNGASWTDISGTVRAGNSDVEAMGNKGTWYVKTYQRSVNGQPSTWELSSFTDTDRAATTVRLPGNISMNKAGCVDFTDETHLCTGINTPVFVNGQWFMVGGTSEARGANNSVSQPAQGGIWKMSGNTFTAVSGLPTFKFVSGVWNSNGHTLIATSNAVSNPFAADHLWLFDGTSLKDVSGQAISAGLLSVDMRDVRAAWNGESWMIIHGKKVVRFDETTMTREDDTRDVFHTVSADANGNFLLGGVVSNLGSAFGSAPLTAKFVTASEDVSTGTPKPNTVLNILLSKVEGPRLTLISQPQDARIGNGRAFSFSVEAYDADGIDHIDIFVNGARIKTCPAAMCEYVQAYWTNGQTSRTVEFSARAVDKQMYANDSEIVKLVIDQQSQAGVILPAEQTGSADPMNTSGSSSTTVPANINWNHDTWSDLDWTTWLDPKPTLLLTGSSTMYHVAAKGGMGVGAIEIWINGAVKRTCTFNVSPAPAVCSFKLTGSDYPYGTEIYMNANVRSRNGLNSWTTPTTVRRDVAPAQAAAPREPRGPVFNSTATLQPAVNAVIRGTSVTFAAVSQNNTNGLARVEIIANGKVQRTCTYGAAVSAVTCDTSIDTSAYPNGTTLTFMARAIDNFGHEVMSNAKSVLIRTHVDQASSSTNASLSKVNVWEWMAPEVSELVIPQTTTYTVGAWSANAIRKIEMIVDGKVTKTCSFSSGTGNRECAFEINTADYSHGHLVTINSRVTDGNGSVAWSQARSILIKRTWEAVNTSGAYINAISPAASYTFGENQTVTIQGWAPEGIKQIDIYVDGSKVTSCPTERCSWIIKHPTNQTIEYSARLVDRLGRETWTPVYGMRRK